MSDLADAVDALATESGFSGAVRVDRGDEVVLARAYGFAHRGYEIPNQPDTRFATASAAKGFTALAVVSLVETGELELSATARSLLGDDLPLIDDAVTVEHLLAHTSGIGDYLDEDDPNMDLNAYLMPVPVHELAETEQYLRVLDGFPTKSPPGEKFAYCNGGFVVLALLAERASGVPYHDLVRKRVTEPAGLKDTEFLRSDELPGRTALGYLDLDGVSRSNIHHIPVRGVGDGGIYTTAADMRTFWKAFFDGRIVSSEWVAEMTRPRNDAPEEDARYGLGFWLHRSKDIAQLVGGDTGVSFVSSHDPAADLTQTVISNTTNGAWPIVKLLAERAEV